jgi:hypothetical protein
MKAITKGLIIMLVLFNAGISRAQRVTYGMNRINNQEIQSKALERFELRTIKNKQEELMINQIGKKIISRRRALNQN